MPGDLSAVADLIPVDVVANMMIATGAYRLNSRYFILRQPKGEKFFSSLHQVVPQWIISCTIQINICPRQLQWTVKCHISARRTSPSCTALPVSSIPWRGMESYPSSERWDRVFSSFHHLDLLWHKAVAGFHYFVLIFNDFVIISLLFCRCTRSTRFRTLSAFPVPFSTRTPPSSRWATLILNSVRETITTKRIGKSQVVGRLICLIISCE